MGILNSIYHWAIRFTGEVVVWFAFAAAALIFLEMIFYQCRSRKKPAGRKRVAVVTGASSGLGRELVRRIDRKEKQIDEIWLVARREERLQALADELQHPARIFALDLTEKDSAGILAATLQKEGVEVALLVCGAIFATPVFDRFMRRFGRSWIGTVVLFLLFWASVIALVDTVYNPFLYFRF